MKPVPTLRCLSGVLLLALMSHAPAALASDTSFKFVVVGDTQSADGTSPINWDVVPQLITDMNTHQPEFALFCGDLVAGAGSVGATVAQWEVWKTATASFTGTRYVGPGNHDFYGGAGSFAAWQQTFDWLPTDNSPAGEEGLTYYFDFGNSRFISILTDHETSGAVPPTQQAWLDAVLADSADKDHVFVFSHHPVSFSSVEVLGTSSGPFWQSLVQNDVDAYFAGHWHRYQPSRIGNGGGTWEVIIGTGGGWQGFQPIRPYQQVHGFLLVEVNGAEAVGTFYSDDDGDGRYDDAVDSFVMRHAGESPVGLVAEYNFEDQTARDWASPPLGRHIHGEFRDDATILAGTPTGNALLLDGDGDHVEAGALADYALALNGDMTLSVVARFDQLDAGSFWSNTLLTYATSDFYSEDEETNYSYWLNIHADRSLIAFWEHDNGSNVTPVSTTPAPVQPSEWHHYAFVRDAAAQTLTFFVDGLQLGDPVAYDRNATGGGRGMLYIGSDTLGGTPFDGAIDDVRIYNRTLTPDEVHSLANDPLLTVSNPVSGDEAIVAISRLTADGNCIVGYSLAGGGPTPTPHGDVLLSRPIKKLSSIRANALGYARRTAEIPVGMAGRRFWLQAYDVSSQTFSNSLTYVTD